LAAERLSPITKLSAVLDAAADYRLLVRRGVEGNVDCEVSVHHGTKKKKKL